MCDVSCSTVDVKVVCFKTMTCRLQKVRRLSSISSVLQPTFLLTTEWLWYWEDEDGNWNQYDSPVSSAPSQSGASLTRLTSANVIIQPIVSLWFVNVKFRVPARGGRVDNWWQSRNMPYIVLKYLFE